MSFDVFLHFILLYFESLTLASHSFIGRKSLFHGLKWKFELSQRKWIWIKTRGFNQEAYACMTRIMGKFKKLDFGIGVMVQIIFSFYLNHKVIWLKSHTNFSIVICSLEVWLESHFGLNQITLLESSEGLNWVKQAKISFFSS